MRLTLDTLIFRIAVLLDLTLILWQLSDLTKLLKHIAAVR